jgi:hypothetical protein
MAKNLASRLMLRPPTDPLPGSAALRVHIKPARSTELLWEPAGHVYVVRRLGYLLFMLSFVTSDMALDGTGIGAFLLAPVAAGLALSHAWSAASWPAALLGSLLVLAWLANPSIFFHLSRPLAGLAMAAPWALFGVFVLRSPDSVFDPQIVTFLPFYFWAMGIALVHGSRWVEQKTRHQGAPVFSGHRTTIGRRAA